MRCLVALVAVSFLIGCSGGAKPVQGPAKGGTSSNGPQPEVDATMLKGEFIGHDLNLTEEDVSQIPASLREVLGDAQLTLDGEGGFTMSWMGMQAVGTYKVDGNQLVMQFEQIEGLGPDDLASVDLGANKRAGKEPSTQEALDEVRRALTVTDWRFKVEDGGFDQLGEPTEGPRFRFKRKPE